MRGQQARPGGPRKRRGAASNPAGRYERHHLAPLEEGVPEASPEAAPAPEPAPDPEWTPPPLLTTVTPEVTRTIITRNDSPDIPFDRSINPYKGCEHGCVYCFARPTHAYLGLSPGLDFETRIVSKPDAPAALRAELGRGGYRCEVMALGSNTDPYQPAERLLRITRGVLEVLAEHRHPVSIVTKSSLVLRDLDLLKEMARDRLASVMISITTMDAGMALRLEPRAASPHRRVETLRALASAGVPSGVLVSPIIPGLTDTEMERILAACAKAGAGSAGYLMLRLPLEVKTLFEEWLQRHYPLRAKRVLSLVRGVRGGRLNDPAFGSRMRGTGPYAEMLRRRFRVACRRLGLDRETPGLDTSLFRVPPRPGGQRSLFEEA